MKLARSVLIAAAFALAAGCSDDKPKSGRATDNNSDAKVTSTESRAPSAAKPTRTAAANKPRAVGFNGLDKNGDGYLSRAEAKGNPQLASNFKAADRNHDGRLNRAEYLAVVTKNNANNAKTAKTTGAVNRKTSARAGGSTVPPP